MAFSSGKQVFGVGYTKCTVNNLSIDIAQNEDFRTLFKE